MSLLTNMDIKSTISSEEIGLSKHNIYISSLTSVYDMAFPPTFTPQMFLSLVSSSTMISDGLNME